MRDSGGLPEKAKILDPVSGADETGRAREDVPSPIRAAHSLRGLFLFEASGGLSADRIDEDRIDRGAGGDEEPVLLDAAEAQIRGGFRQMDPADQGSARGIAAHAVFLGIAPPHRAPDVAVGVRPDAVGITGREIFGEELAVAQFAVGDVEDADVGLAAAVDDVELLLVGGEGETVRLVEVAGDHRQLAGARIEAINRLLELLVTAIAFVE